MRNVRVSAFLQVLVVILSVSSAHAGLLATDDGPTLFANAISSGGPELLVNGNFESGNTGFTSSYAYNTNLTLETRYFIGADPHTHHSFAISFPDHSGAGLMFLANAGANASSVVWQQSVPVSPSTTYRLTGWATSWGRNPSNSQPIDPSPAVLRLAINGATVLGSYNVPAADGVWGQFFVDWSSGAASSASIQIFDTVTAGIGNDFALDDLSFAVPEPTGGVIMMAVASVLMSRRRAIAKSSTI